MWASKRILPCDAANRGSRVVGIYKAKMSVSDTLNASMLLKFHIARLEV